MVGDRCNFQTTAGKWCNFLDAICLCECLCACIGCADFSAWCALRNNEDAKVALGWRTHQARETEHLILALIFIYLLTRRGQNWCNFFVMATFKIKAAVFIWCAGLTRLVTDTLPSDCIKWASKRESYFNFAFPFYSPAIKQEARQSLANEN